MKNAGLISLLLFLFYCLITYSGCGGGGGGGEPPGGTDYGDTITITGSLDGGLHSSKSIMDKAFEILLPSAYALNPSDVRSVLALYPSGASYRFQVTNSTFELQLYTASSVGIIFLGENDNYLGYLTLGNGIDTMPLGYVADGVNRIDLGILSSTGYVVEPSNNPIGDEIPTTQEMLAMIAAQDDFLASMVQNPDADDNGIIDALEDKLYMMRAELWMVAGDFYPPYQSVSLIVPPYTGNSSVKFYVKDNKPPDNFAYFTGPVGSGLDNSQSTLADMPSDMQGEGEPTFRFHSPGIMGSAPPPGQYLVNYKEQTFEFHIDESLDNSIVYIVPELELNNDNTLHKISWSYVLNDGVTAVDSPQSFIEYTIEMLIVGLNGREYTFRTNRNNSEHILSDQAIVPISLIRIFYKDTCGNMIWQEYIGQSTARNSVQGHAYLQDETDHSGITITLSGETQESAETDASGYYFISGFPDGTYLISASKTGYVTDTKTDWVFEPAHHQVDFLLDLDIAQ